MEILRKFDRRQMGYDCENSYDIAIKKLSCLKLDEYRISRAHDLERQEPPTLACKFAEAPTYQHILALANEEGAIAIQDIHKRHTDVDINFDPPTVTGNIIHYNAIFDLAWKFEEMKLVTASGDHTTRLWNITESDVVQERQFLSHDRSVKTVAFQKNSSIFASGGRDSSICIWDTRALPHALLVSKADSIINCNHMHTPKSKSLLNSKRLEIGGNKINSITGLVFQDDYTLISCSAGEGTIRCWDMRKSYSSYNHKPIPKHVLPYLGSSLRRGYTNLLIDSTSLRLYASCLDDRIYCYNIGTYSANAVMEYKGHQTSNSFYVKSCLSPDGKYLLSGSFDGKAYIWNIHEDEPIITLNGHQTEVTCVAWCQSRELVLVTCSDDSRHKIWRIPESPPKANDLVGTNESIKKIKPVRSRSPQKFESLSKRARLYEASCASTSKRAAESPPLSTPTKRPRRLFADTSTSDTLATLLTTKSSSGLAENVLSNLPNFVVDGTAPHLRVISPQKKIQNRDWIGQFRKEQEIRKRMIDECKSEDSSSPKSVKYDSGCSNSPKIVRTPKQGKRKPSTSTPPRAQSPLLKYFKVTIKENNTQGSLSPSSSLNLSPFSSSKKMW